MTVLEKDAGHQFQIIEVIKTNKIRHKSFLKLVH